VFRTAASSLVGRVAIVTGGTLGVDAASVRELTAYDFVM